jgi:hypothetical protein
MHLREGTPHDADWLVGYILGGFSTEGYTPSHMAIRAMIEHTRANGYGRIAEQAGQPVGVIGAVVHPMFWTGRNELQVVALRSTRPGAGRMLIQGLMAWARERLDLQQVVVTVENPDPRVEKMMRRYGKPRVLRSFVFNPWE